MPRVELPPKSKGQSNVVFEDARSIVVVGANGSGKSRLGTFVEQTAGDNAHRISAQRSLAVPPFVQPRAYEQAESTLLYGYYEPTLDQKQRSRRKASSRWGNEPQAHTLNDYEHLLALLFADEAKRDRDYARAARSTLPTERPPSCKLDSLAAIWKAVMPHRSLIIGDDRVLAQPIEGGATYEGRHMSDGEKVAFYLMGQALCAPVDGIVIIDEPEIHLHRAIQALLWDQLEAARVDCTFVYITHDLEFAATRVGGRRIWLQEFDGTTWCWDEIDRTVSLPDALTMQVLGTRRPVLFVEGDEASYDAAIYAALYPKEHVVPRESCAKVVEATKAMASLPAFHHREARGLVDRDRRGEAEILALAAANVHVVEVAEVENLLCIPEAISAVAERLHTDPQKIVDAKAAVLKELGKQRDQQALARALSEIQFRMNGFGPRVAGSNAGQLEVELKAYVDGIDVAATVASAKKLFDGLLAAGDYMEALQYFNCKGNVAFVAGALGLEPEAYISTVLGVLKTAPDCVAAVAMRKLVGF